MKWKLRNNFKFQTNRLVAISVTFIDFESSAAFSLQYHQPRSPYMYFQFLLRETKAYELAMLPRLLLIGCSQKNSVSSLFVAVTVITVDQAILQWCRLRLDPTPEFTFCSQHRRLLVNRWDGMGKLESEWDKGHLPVPNSGQASPRELPKL